MNFAREQVSDIRVELEPLLLAHYREIAHYQDIALKPDWQFYCTSPALRVFTVRDDGVLIGYAIYAVGRNKHYTDSLQAVQDVLYIAADKRKGPLGWRFLRYCDEQLKAEGVQVVYQHVKAAHDFGPLLKRMGYEAVEVIHAKRLDKE